ncbi:MAG: hypothetical protein J6P36_00300 [Lachnospiraceae bacterium]|nr:hypothetical protein [Lachnospiraceae bacterium]
MAVVNVYERYFEASCEYNGVPRKAALVMLTADSCEGNIRYSAGVTFFPHRDEEDYAVSYDAFFERTLFEGKGRRSKKREQTFLTELQTVIGELAAEQDAEVFWDKPLREERRG